MPLTQTDRLLTVTTPLGADAVLLTGFRGREELSRPFAFQLDLVTDTPIAASDVVGKAVSWQVVFPDEAPRHFHGLVRSLAVGPGIGRVREYRAEVVPWLWSLTRATDCRIFQNLSVPDILKEVFGRYGFSDFKDDLTGSYAAREYCVQYRESAFDFVSRLMEEEGIGYTFTQTADAHTLVLFDAVSAYQDCDPHASVEFRPELANAEVIGTWERRYAFVSRESGSHRLPLRDAGDEPASDDGNARHSGRAEEVRAVRIPRRVHHRQPRHRPRGCPHGRGGSRVRYSDGERPLLVVPAGRGLHPGRSPARRRRAVRPHRRRARGQRAARPRPP